MTASLKRIGALIVKELHQVVRDPGNVGIAVILPAVLLLLFGYGMSMDIKNVRIAYLAVPASSQSTDLETRLTLSRYFQTTRVFSTREAEEKLRTHEADAFIALQSNAPDTLHNGTTKVQIVVNGVNANQATLIRNYLQAVVGSWASSLGGRTAPVLDVQTRTRFNEANDSHYYLVPGVIVTIMTMIGALLTSLVMAREYIGREIAVAVKEGGPDPDNNSRLRDVIAKAKANNMPNDTIERGIKKAAGDADSVNYEQITYEGYGPSGVAIIVDTLTDNKNRTASNVRNAFTKGNGNVGTPGCVSYMFEKKGQIIISKEECEMDADDLMMMALDAGAEDFNEEEDSFEVLTTPEDFSAVREALEKEEVPMADASVTMIPGTMVELTSEEDIKNIQKTLDLLDEDDDVQEVYTNWDE